jgi:hypothetical protein
VRAVANPTAAARDRLGSLGSATGRRLEALFGAVADLANSAVDRMLVTGERITSAGEGRAALSETANTEELADQVQRVVVLAVPVVRTLARGARLTRMPWVMVASTTTAIGLSVRGGVRELQVVAALVAHRLGQASGYPPDPALVKRLAVDLYLNPRRAPGTGAGGARLFRLTRRWVLGGALGLNTSRRAYRALEAAERLDVRAALAATPRHELASGRSS